MTTNNSIKDAITDYVAQNKTFNHLTLAQRCELIVKKVLDDNGIDIDAPGVYAISIIIDDIDELFNVLAHCMREAANDIDNQDYIKKC